MANEKATTHRGKDARKRKTRVALPKWISERIAGETEEDFRRRYSRQRYSYLKENDPEFAAKCRDNQARMRAIYGEKIKAKKLVYCELNRDKEKARAAEWFKENRPHGLNTRRAYYQSHKEEHRAAAREWNAKNPDRLYAIKHAQRTKGREASGRFTAEDINRIFQQQRGKCALCKVKLGANKHLDHIQPIHKGGTNHPRNLQWLCAPCNQRKSHKDPIDFSREIGLLL